ncbi:neutral/alkaline non-lysosomal ceramidase N-terminal domain-containing protein [Echinicola vietnamensis]|uniref:Neutral/alkaline non-lysosomal ceramidase n=1 Tax=Echinicola vietnamensis (strain DSM 17526 / LMG 23754 / KMM 6221) TaxID=926556 RepID=L0FWA0_ECHVK|nr:neutral/alkaline non-lysosomal ceramidase N-terminal domain-containing protein [Echinicola vietnamensis]AGA77011.1 Neutral/alkaline non-lysosomal ceramidase [Echinicola vietnamensis DSM 17526]
MRKFLQILAWTTGLFLLLAITLLTTVDWTDPKEQDYYKKTVQAVSELQPTPSAGDAWLAGWAQVNVTPDQPVDLVGYKPRGAYDFVLDSSFVKAIVVGNGDQRVAFLNYELLIVHPVLAKTVEKTIKNAALPVDLVYFTGTHTHSGMGGYMPGIMGKIAFGGYDEKVVNLLAEKSAQAVEKALKSQDTVAVTYQKYSAPQFVGNRFIPNGPIDPFIRQLVFTKGDGTKGTLFTYTAHATCLNSKFMGLSGDYPFYLTQDMLNDYDFSMFAAGTVGSHQPLAPGREPKDIKAYAHQLDSLMEQPPLLRDTVQTKRLTLGTLVPQLPEATYRISDNIRLRPWVFNNLFGDTNAHFDVVQLGNTLLISSSGELSGMFYKKWEALANQKGLNLIITSFNGGYMGYIVPDQYYHRSYFEARDMNWFGPYSGSYYDMIITKLIQAAD